MDTSDATEDMLLAAAGAPRAAVPATPPAAPRAPPLKKPANAASAKRICASCAVKVSSSNALLPTLIPSCATSVTPSTAADWPVERARSLERALNIEPSFAARLVATLPKIFNSAASPATPTPATGAPTIKARRAVLPSSASPESSASLAAPAVAGTYSAPKAPE